MAYVFQMSDALAVTQRTVSALKDTRIIDPSRENHPDGLDLWSSNDRSQGRDLSADFVEAL